MGQKLPDINLLQSFLRYDTKSTGNKGKNRQMRLHQTKSFSTVKETEKWKSKLQNMRKYLQTTYLMRGQGTLTI